MFEIDQIDAAMDGLNLAACLDHSGRGGNLFFLTIFDRHREVLSVPLFHYTYSYLDSYFGREREILGSDAQHSLSTVAYTRLLYQDPVGYCRAHRKNWCGFRDSFSTGYLSKRHRRVL